MMFDCFFKMIFGKLSENENFLHLRELNLLNAFLNPSLNSGLPTIYGLSRLLLDLVLIFSHFLITESTKDLILRYCKDRISFSCIFHKKT